MKIINKITILLPAFILLSGCASIMEGSDQTINVNTTGCEQLGPMRCNVTNSEGSSVLTAPASVSVEKARGPLTISCASPDRSATGLRRIQSSYEAMNAGNILAGGIIGIGVDAATGAMWKYPSSVNVGMTCGNRSSTTSSTKRTTSSTYITDGSIKKRWPDGRVYEGAFKNDLPNGNGVLSLVNGDKYNGNFVVGLYDGSGRYTWSSGKEYVGDFTRGISKGQGTIKFINGDEYRGNVLDGAPHGQGTMKYWDNSVSKGIWLDGVFQTD
jgi:hypothetical protein